MFSDQIERMKRQYTDKYVVVDGSRPELARFRDVVGRVKSVNMNGQVLVEFDDYHLNTGWYDIAPEFLKLVDKPPPKAPKPEVKKAPAKEKPATAAKPPAAKAPAAKAGKGSVADILAAARAGKPAAEKTQVAEPAAEKPPTAEPPKPAKVDRSKMSVTDMLAAARAGAAAGLVPAKAKAEAPAPAKTQAEQAPVQEDAVTEEPAAETPSAPEAAAPSEKTVQRVDKSGMSIDDILAYCRQHDAK